MLLIKNGNIHNAVQEEAFIADILIDDNGKISAIDKDITAPDGAQVLDASGLQVMPGFVEAHGHIGLDGYGMGFEGMDYNEISDVCTPHLRGIDGIKAMDPAFQLAANAGVTTVCVGPGSANVVGGTFVAIKTVGKRVDDMVVRNNVAMKCAFGENPKRCYRDKGNMTRMTTSANLRNLLEKTIEYKAKKDAAAGDPSKKPAYDQKLEAMLPVIEKKIPLKAHAHATDDIFAAIRIAREYGVKLTLEHTTEGHLIAEELAKEKDIPMAVGPSLTNASKIELRNKTFATPGILAKAGCKVSIITDSPVIPQQYLPLCAALAVESGMDEFEAFKAITINAAEHAGVGDIVGSLEIGKDGDVVITDGCPFKVQTKVKYVFIKGKKVNE
ncbi:MAG: amidohydrolase [Lachnospiraceae bacterium]|nr:amidohydrolase [Lachnospiraceae bacterium]